MRPWCYLGGVIAAALLVPPAVAAETCSHKLLTSVDAELGPHNELLVHVKIDDQPETLLLDTGAVSSVMFENAVARLGLSRTSTRSTVFGVDGRPLDEMTSLPSLALGTAVSRGTQFPVSPAASGKRRRAAGRGLSAQLRCRDRSGGS